MTETLWVGRLWRCVPLCGHGQVFEGHPGNSMENNFGEGSLEVSRLNRKLLHLSKAVVPNPEWATESLEGHVRIQTAGLQPQSF